MPKNINEGDLIKVKNLFNQKWKKKFKALPP